MTITSTEIATTPEMSALVKTAFLQIESGKATFGQALAAVLFGEMQHEQVTVSVSKPIKITDAHRAALEQIVQAYGQVAPETPRLLTDTEALALLAERDLIDTILGLLKKRKDESIREALANHLDRLAEAGAGGPEVADDRFGKDKHGHYTVKQDVPVEGSGKKIQGIVGEPKPVVSSESLLDAHLRGDLTREEYLAITKVPEVGRVFDEEKARAAIKKNPEIFFKIARVTTIPAKTLTIKTASA